MEELKVTENTTTDHQNRSREVTFEKRKLSAHFLSYHHVTNGLALIMKDKAKRNRELTTNEKRTKTIRKWLMTKDSPNSWRIIL